MKINDTVLSVVGRLMGIAAGETGVEIPRLYAEVFLNYVTYLRRVENEAREMVKHTKGDDGETPCTSCYQAILDLVEPEGEDEESLP